MHNRNICTEIKTPFKKFKHGWWQSQCQPGSSTAGFTSSVASGMTTDTLRLALGLCTHNRNTWTGLSHTNGHKCPMYPVAGRKTAIIFNFHTAQPLNHSTRCSQSANIPKIPYTFEVFCVALEFHAPTPALSHSKQTAWAKQQNHER